MWKSLNTNSKNSSIYNRLTQPTMNFLYKILFPVTLWFYWILTKCLSIFLNKKNIGEDSVLYLENFPIENSGYQYRAYKWAETFSQNGIKCEIKTILPDKHDFDICSPQRFLIISMRKRFWQCLYARRFKTVIVRREILQFNDYGNLFMDKFLLKIHANVILDFDDDIASAKRQPREITSLYGKLLLENGNKFNDSLRIYHKFIVGSEYLKNKVLNETHSITNDDILVIPTCVDYDKYPAKEYHNDNDEITLGWIGGNHNLHYLDKLIEPLNLLSKDYKLKLVVVAGKDYEHPSARFKIENKQWSLEEEKDLIRSFDIGLMPIEDNATGRGKCGFKLLQYMGLGVIGVATNVTINGEIIDDGVNGFLVKPDNSNWHEVLLSVISHKSHWKEISNNGRKDIVLRYSFTSNAQAYLSFLSNQVKSHS